MTNHPIPAAALDDRLAIVGTTGSGKTYAAGTAVERILHRNDRVIIVDPLGVWWGLRLKADGTPAFNVPIFGGSHADLPITDVAGQVIGETVAGMAESVIIDLSTLGTKAAERRFMYQFLSALYRKTVGTPVHIVLDEADMWAPQRLLDKDGDAAKLLGMMETIVRRGRIKGFIPWLITQRPAVLSKDVLSQADGLIAFKLTSSQDRDAIGAWVEGQADKSSWREMFAELAKLDRGTGLVWLPGRQILTIKLFPAKTTFDSSRTPRRGEAGVTAKLQPLNLGALRERLAGIEQDVKSNDPAALKGEIRELRKQLAAAKPGPDASEINSAWERGRIAGFNNAIDNIRELTDKLEALGPDPTELPPKTLAVRPPPVPEQQPEHAALSPSAGRIVNIIHQSYPVSLSFDAAARRAGVSKRSSAYGKYRAEVEACKELVSQDGKFRSDPLFSRVTAIAHAGIDAWISRLPPSYGRMLRAIADGHKTREAIAAAAGVSITSSGLNSGLRELSDLELAVQHGNEYTLAEGL